MDGQRRQPIRPAIDDVQRAHNTDLEAVFVQLRAVGEALEALSAAVEALGHSLPDGLPSEVADHVETSRWQLQRIG